MVCRMAARILMFGRRGGACPSRISQGNAQETAGRASHGPYHASSPRRYAEARGPAFFMIRYSLFTKKVQP